MKHLLNPLRYLHPAIVPALLVCGSTMATELQTANPEQEHVLVTTPRILPDADGIDMGILEATRAATSDTARLLGNVPGVNMQVGGGVSSLPVIHGMADDRLRIKVDGMDLISACGNHMNPPLSYIDPTHVDSATVFAGITPVSIGGDSIGSTILVDSPSPSFAPDDEVLTEGKIGISYRSNGGALSSNLTATIASRKFSLSYHGSTTEADDYVAGGEFKPAGPAASGREWLDGDEVGSTMYESTNHSVAMALQLENHLFELKLGKQDIPYQGFVNQRMDMTGNDSTQSNLYYEGRYDWGTLEGRIYGEQTRHKMQFFDDKLFWYGPNMTAPDTDGIACSPSPGMNGCAGGMPMDTDGENAGLVVKATVALSENDLLRLGFEAQNYELDDWWEPSGRGMWPDTFWNINSGERDRLAFFTEWESKLGSQWLVQLGARYENVEMNTGEVQGYSPMMAQYGPESAAFNAADRNKSDDNVDLTALARYQVDSARAIEFGYARKSRSPNLYERYSWSTGGMVMRMINTVGDGNGYVGNLELEPEIAHTLSATFEWHDTTEERWQLTVAPYFTYVEDYIDAARCTSANMNCGPGNQGATDAFVYLQFVNQSAHMYGVDIAGSLPLTESSEYGDFDATVMLSYIRGENRSSEDDLYNIMPLNAKFALNHSKESWTNSLEFEVVDNKADISQVRNELRTSGYSLFHLRSSYRWESVSINFGIENVFDRFYNHPLGGAYLGQGKTMSGTGVPWGIAVPGMGRSIYTGVYFRF